MARLRSNSLLKLSAKSTSSNLTQPRTLPRGTRKPASHSKATVRVAETHRWYFDAINPSTNETIVFNFELQWPADNTTSEVFYTVTIFGSFANGTAYRYVVKAENVNITERADKSMRVDYFGSNEVSWSGSSLLEPRPVYNLTINAPQVGITGSIILQGNVRASQPH